jgi:LemA protein
MKTFLITVLVIGLLVFSWIIGIYNALIAMIEAINNNKRQIDIQLDRRFKVFSSLIESVKQYMDYEKTTLKDVIALRNQAESAKVAGDEQQRMVAENEISHIASKLHVVFEQYPELKAGRNMLQLQEEVVNTENKLAYAKQAYNDSIERYYAKKKSFFESMVVSLFSGKLDQTYLYWSLSDEQIQTQEAYAVKF